MAGGGKDVLSDARIVNTVAEAIDDCALAVGCTSRSRRWNWPVVDPKGLAQKAFETQGPVAILFGREDSGLENDALARCQMLLQIPTDGDPSLNLSQAVLLVCWNLFEHALELGWVSEEKARQGKRSGGPAKGPKKARKAQRKPADLGLQKRVIEEGIALLEKTPYMASKSREQVEVQLGQLLQRLGATEVETDILRGMIRKTKWALENPLKNKA